MSGDAEQCPGEMCICNHECGSMSAQQGALWNAGKARVLQHALSIVGAGAYYQNGGNYSGIVGSMAGGPRLQRRGGGPGF
eukprot:COSAG01_NODE_50352_length_364_cov_0.588679_1_plen_79_part_01